MVSHIETSGGLIVYVFIHLSFCQIFCGISYSRYLIILPFVCMPGWPQRHIKARLPRRDPGLTASGDRNCFSLFDQIHSFLKKKNIDNNK